MPATFIGARHASADRPVPGPPVDAAGAAPAGPTFAPGLSPASSGRGAPLARAQPVHDVGDAGDALGKILGPAPCLAAVDRAAQRDLAAVDGDLDPAGIELGIVGEPLVDVLEDARIRAPVAPRATAAMAGGLVPLLGETAAIFLVAAAVAHDVALAGGTVVLHLLHDTAALGELAPPQLVLGHR